MNETGQQMLFLADHSWQNNFHRKCYQNSYDWRSRCISMQVIKYSLFIKSLLYYTQRLLPTFQLMLCSTICQNVTSCDAILVIPIRLWLVTSVHWHCQASISKNIYPVKCWATCWHGYPSDARYKWNDPLLPSHLQLHSPRMAYLSDTGLLGLQENHSKNDHTTMPTSSSFTRHDNITRQWHRHIVATLSSSAWQQHPHSVATSWHSVDNDAVVSQVMLA